MSNVRCLLFILFLVIPLVLVQATICSSNCTQFEFCEAGDTACSECLPVYIGSDDSGGCNLTCGFRMTGFELPIINRFYKPADRKFERRPVWESCDTTSCMYIYFSQYLAWWVINNDFDPSSSGVYAFVASAPNTIPLGNNTWFQFQFVDGDFVRVRSNAGYPSCNDTNDKTTPTTILPNIAQSFVPLYVAVVTLGPLLFVGVLLLEARLAGMGWETIVTPPKQFNCCIRFYYVFSCSLKLPSALFHFSGLCFAGSAAVVVLRTVPDRVDDGMFLLFTFVAGYFLNFLCCLDESYTWKRVGILLLVQLGVSSSTTFFLFPFFPESRSFEYSLVVVFLLWPSCLKLAVSLVPFLRRRLRWLDVVYVTAADRWSGAASQLSLIDPNTRRHAAWLVSWSGKLLAGGLISDRGTLVVLANRSLTNQIASTVEQRGLGIYQSDDEFSVYVGGGVFLTSPVLGKSVFSGRWQHQQVAVRMFRASHRKEQTRIDAQREVATVRVLGAAKTTCFVRFLFQLPLSGADSCMVYELCDYNLQRVVDQSLLGISDVWVKQSVAREILQAVAMLHELGIAHCKLSPKSVVFVGTTLKLCSFGSAVSSFDFAAATSEDSLAVNIRADLRDTGEVLKFLLGGEQGGCNGHLTSLLLNPTHRMHTARACTNHPALWNAEKIRSFFHAVREKFNGCSVQVSDAIDVGEWGQKLLDNPPLGKSSRNWPNEPKRGPKFQFDHYDTKKQAAFGLLVFIRNAWAGHLATQFTEMSHNEIAIYWTGLFPSLLLQTWRWVQVAPQAKSFREGDEFRGFCWLQEFVEEDYANAHDNYAHVQLPGELELVMPP